MSGKKEVDPMQMCRICAVDVADDSEPHLLIENNRITDLGEKFISCLGIQLMKEGYPERVCDYCQLQLNTFHAFVRKAKMTSSQFETMLQEMKQNEGDGNEDDENEDNEDTIMNSGLLAPTDMKYDDAQDDIDDIHDKRSQESIEVEFIVDHSRVDLKGDEEMSANEENGEEDEYTVEYLEPEYMNTFVNEIAQNEDDDEYDTQTDSTDKNKSQAKIQSKRTYPYKCVKCNKRFVYKEVYEAHIRIHKGLPGFSCPHCPKTFNEKSNFDYHMQDHTNYRPAKCHLCEKSFKNKQDLASHIRCHKDIRKYMCDVCGKRFRSQSHMTYHRYAHFEERNFACDQCEQKFKSPHILRTHRNTVHSNVFRYECEVCGRKFKRDHHLVAHRKTHNKTPGKRKKAPAKKTVEKASAKLSDNTSPEFEMVQMIKEEGEIDLDYGEEEYEAEFITD